ncbi:hypothetical protein [Azospirillum melinis]
MSIFLSLAGLDTGLTQLSVLYAKLRLRNDSTAAAVMNPAMAGLFGSGRLPQGKTTRHITAWGLAMNLWTFSMQASMCCMLSWMRACQQGAAFAHSFTGMPLLTPPRPPADVLPFRTRRTARGGGFGGPAVVIPLGRR